MPTKVCSKCGIEKEISDFYKRKARKSGIKSECKDCCKTYYNDNADKFSKRSKLFYLENRQNKIDAAMQRTHGITRQQYNDILDRQGGVCAICKCAETSIDWHTKKIRPLAVDHDHYTGVVRGLLCDKCNRAIGFIKDSPIVAKSMMNYLVDNSARGIDWGLFSKIGKFIEGTNVKQG